MGKTLFEKIWESHVVVEKQNGPSLIYVDRHLVHEVTSPQAFDGLRMNKRKVRRPDLTIATMDHNVPTNDRSLPILDQTSAVQIQTLEKNCKVRLNPRCRRRLRGQARTSCSASPF